MRKRDCLLVCNAGSTTLKVKIFKLADLTVLVSGSVERIGWPGSTLELNELTSGRMIRRNFPPGVRHHRDAFGELAGHLKHWQARMRAVAHRIVHGGPNFRKPTWLNAAVVQALHELSRIAPLHNPINLDVVAQAAQVFPDAPSLGVFDTAYYARLPASATTYAIPHELAERFHIRRYGFHGLSHQYLAQAAAAKLRRPLGRLRLITAHLGSGCSLTATKFGVAVETTMGFTPLSGLTMSTRSGDVDPAVVTFLQRVCHLGVGEVDDLLNTRSGLRGIFGYSGDLRDVLVAAGYAVAGYAAQKTFSATERRRAKLALGVFIYDIVRYLGSLATVMGGLDAIVFSGAIGVRSPVVRALVRQHLRFWSGVKTVVIPTDEELMMARLTQRMVQGARRLAPSPTPPANDVGHGVGSAAASPG